MNTNSPSRLCHLDDCTARAVYRARLDWTAQPEVLLCVDHAAAERPWHSVIKIESANA